MMARHLPFLHSADDISEALRRSRWNRPRTSPLRFETKELRDRRARSKSFDDWNRKVHEARESGRTTKRVKRPKPNKPVPHAPVPRPARSPLATTIDAGPSGGTL